MNFTITRKTTELNPKGCTESFTLENIELLNKHDDDAILYEIIKCLKELVTGKRVYIEFTETSSSERRYAIKAVASKVKLKNATKANISKRKIKRLSRED